MKQNNPIETRAGLAITGDNIFFGYSVAQDLAGIHSYSSLVAMAVSGKKLKPELAPILDDIAAVITVADIRLWPMKTVRLVSAYGNAFPAIASGSLIFQTERYGPLSASPAAALLADLFTDLDGKIAEDRLKQLIAERMNRGEKLIGVGVPFRKDDERFVLLRECLERRDRTTLPYWTLCETLTKVLRCGEKKLRPNISLGVAAALLDLGFKAPEVGPVSLGLMSHILLAVAWEGAQNPAPQLRQLPLESVRYVGKAPRLSPRAQAEKQQQDD